MGLFAYFFVFFFFSSWLKPTPAPAIIPAPPMADVVAMMIVVELSLVVCSLS